MTRKITSLDVAERAGVSQSAVSRVFTPGASVSKKMADKVRKAADELGYRPNVLARSLITGRTRIIGLVVAYLDNMFYPDALERLSNALQAEGYHILVFMARGRGAEADRVIEELLDYQVDGIVAASVGMSDELTSRCEKAGIPVVLFNREMEDPRFSAVVADNKTGGAIAARALMAGGHRRIAHISGWLGASTGRDRADGFVGALEASGQKPIWVDDGAYSRDTCAAIVRARFSDPATRPDALFVGNDHMAFAALDVLRSELGLSVPDDVSVIGFDDVAVAAWPVYDLTTLRQPIARMVDATVAALLGRIEQGRAPERQVLETRLVRRSSARLPEGWTDDDAGI